MDSGNCPGSSSPCAMRRSRSTAGASILLALFFILFCGVVAVVVLRFAAVNGERTAEQIKIEIGSAKPYENETSIEIKGRNQVDGLPKNVVITSEEVRNAMTDPISQIIDTIRLTLEKTPPELSADIIDRGITLTGGGALLRGFAELIAEETGMPVTVAANPLDCVVLGTAKRLEADSGFDNYVFRRGKRFR